MKNIREKCWKSVGKSVGKKWGSKEGAKRMKNKKRVAVFASGSGSNMQAIVDFSRKEKAAYEVVLLLSNVEDAYVLERAKKEKIPGVFINRKEYPTSKLYTEALDKVLQAYQVDIVALAGFLQMLPKFFVGLWHNKIVNIHPSLLPSFGGKGCYGLAVHEMAIARGVKISGATIHFVTEGYDEGPIIMQKAIEVRDMDTAETLQKRILEEIEWDIYPRTLQRLASETVEINNNRVYFHK